MDDPLDYDVFISHASEDKSSFVEPLAEALRAAAVHVWYDKFVLDWGQDLRPAIEAGLSRSRFGIVVFSKAFLDKRKWTEAELNALFARETATEKLILPIWHGITRDDLLRYSPVLADRLAKDSQVASIEEIVQAVRQKLGYKPIESEASSHYSFQDICYLLLMVDQFSQGIWGASLEKTAVNFGHGGDPGSISVSTWSCIGITKYCSGKRPPGSIEAIDRFGRYLAQRQHPKSGAFGMRKQIGNSIRPQFAIQEHGRHTATALYFYLFLHGPDHAAAKNALQYLLKTRTPNGLWTDVGPLTDDNTDPLTVAYIIETFNYLLEIENGSLNEDLRHQIAAAISQGLNYIFNECSLKNQYGWTFKITDPSQREKIEANVYNYTTDILVSITPACMKHPEYKDYEAEIRTMLTRLLAGAKRHHGLPCGPYSIKRSFDTTIYLVVAALLFSEFRSEVLTLCEELENSWRDAAFMTDSTAAGWATALSINRFCGSSDRTKPTHLLEQLSQKISSMEPNQIALPPQLHAIEQLVANLLTTKRAFLSAEL